MFLLKMYVMAPSGEALENSGARQVSASGLITNGMTGA
jgi:hypothetical protein